MYSRVYRCALSGTYRKDREGLLSAYHELALLCQVLSPHRLTFEPDDTLFVKDVAEANLPQEVIQRHHLLAIAQSDFLWMHVPGGYIGRSGALEVGYACARGIPIFSADTPTEPVFQSFVTTVPSVYKALEILSRKK